jgi:hypothetical protein
MPKLLVPILVAALPALARADGDAAKQAAAELEPFFQLWETMRDDPGSRAESLATDPQVADCDHAIATAKKAGLADGARLYARYLDWDDVHYDDKQQAYVTLGESAAICKRWREMLLVAPAAAKQTLTAGERHTAGLVEPTSFPNLDVYVTAGKDCLAITDKAIALGAPKDHKVKIRDEVMSLAEGREKVCQGILDWAAELGPKIKAAHAADREQRAAPYRAAGVTGAKLDLFLEYDDVYWRGGKGCQIISDLKQLAKAKALFHWLENSDGTHTIRKYTFKGNKVSGPMSKTYRNAGAAQKGCK